MLLHTPGESAHTAFSIAIGTAVEGESDGWGILCSSFDIETGCFGEVTPAAKFGSSATFLCQHPSLPMLYAVGRSDNYPLGALAAFTLDGCTLKLVAEASSGGSTPCHLCVNEAATVLAVANYDDGTVSTLSLRRDGVPSFAFATRTIGKGPNRERQDGSHPHGVYFRGDILHVPDLGLDKVHQWQLDAVSGKPDWGSPSSWHSAAGSGPRHMAFSPNGRHAYVVNELDSTVSALKYEEVSGGLVLLDCVSTLPEGVNVSNTTAEIAIHPNGTFLYASNRGHDSIAVFSRDEISGRLRRILVAPAGGKNPRHFAISPDGGWLVCAHQDSSTVATLPLDARSGMIGEPRTTIHCPHPICVLFLR